MDDNKVVSKDIKWQARYIHNGTDYEMLGTDLERYVSDEYKIHRGEVTQGSLLHAKLIERVSTLQPEFPSLVVAVNLWQDKDTSAFPAIAYQVILTPYTYQATVPTHLLYKVDYTIEYTGASCKGTFDVATRKFMPAGKGLGTLYE